MAAKLIASVRFPKCGAEFHPAFKDAHEVDGMMVIDFPVRETSYLKSRKAQMTWAENKVKHIRSWGVAGQVIIHG